MTNMHVEITCMWNQKHSKNGLNYKTEADSEAQKLNTVTKGEEVVVQSLGHIQLSANPWTAACQASLSFTISWSLLKLMSIEVASNHLIFHCPLLLLPSIFPSMRVFSDESAVCIRCPKYWSFSFIISPANKYSGLSSLKEGKGIN